MDYFVSVLRHMLWRHPEFERLTQHGESVIYENRHAARPSFYIGEENGRDYFWVNRDELGDVTAALLGGQTPLGSSNVMTQVASKETIPRKMRDRYEALFHNLIKTEV